MAERLASIALQAVGGRPKYTGLPNEKELCITSDDLFSLATPPGMPVHTILYYSASRSGPNRHVTSAAQWSRAHRPVHCPSGFTHRKSLLASCVPLSWHAVCSDVKHVITQQAGVALRYAALRYAALEKD